jgi:hypothetical protein
MPTSHPIRTLAGLALAASTASLTGCGSYSVIKQAQSPNGTSAFLVARGTPGMASDTYFLALSHKTNLSSFDLARAFYSHPPLYLTDGRELNLKWSANNDLHVICADCGIAKIDVLRRDPQASNILISYEGFPNGTAADCSSDKMLADPDCKPNQK